MIQNADGTAGFEGKGGEKKVNEMAATHPTTGAQKRKAKEKLFFLLTRQFVVDGGGEFGQVVLDVVVLDTTSDL
jgi:hypothetical protein